MPDMNEEFLGVHKVHIDSTELPKTEKLNFTVKEYIGFEILDTSGNPITDPNGLTHRQIIQTGPLGEFRVNLELDEIWIENEHNIAEIKFGEDDRNCWVATGFINRKAMDSLAEIMNKDIDQKSTP